MYQNVKTFNLRLKIIKILKGSNLTVVCYLALKLLKILFVKPGWGTWIPFDFAKGIASRSFDSATKNVAPLRMLAMKEGGRFRMISWMALVPFALFWLAQGRGYYTGPIYPMLLAAGAVVFERWLAAMSQWRARLVAGIAWSGLLFGGIFVALIALPIVPIN